MAKKPSTPPGDQRGKEPDASPLNGIVPPREHRWKPGQVPNPLGYNQDKRQRVTDRMERILHEDGGRIAEALAIERVKSALRQLKKDKDDGFEKLIDRLEGPIKQILDQTNREGRAEEMDDTELAQALSQLIGGGEKPEAKPKSAKKASKKKATKKATRKRPPKTDE